MSEVEKAAEAAVQAARQGDQYAAMLAVVHAEMAQRQTAALPVVHVHQAPPDRTVQRLALGAGVGGGAVAAAVYFGPLLIASLEAMAVIVLAGALAIAVLAWAIVHLVGGVKTSQTTGRRGRRR